MFDHKNLPNYDEQYLDLIEDILDNGVRKGDRTGTGTLCTVGRSMKFDLTGGRIPLLTTKKVFHKGIVHELLWMISGSTNIRYLKANNVSIWDGWLIPGTEEYREMTLDELLMAMGKIDPVIAGLYMTGDVEGVTEDNIEYNIAEWLKERCVNTKVLVAGDIGKGYGQQWRAWEDTRIINADQVEAFAKRGFSVQGQLETNSLACMGKGQPQVVVQRVIDQMANAIQLLRTNPDSRRIIVNAWNVSCIDEMALPPCHLLFHFCTIPLWTDHSDGTRDYDWKECIRIAMENGSNDITSMYKDYVGLLDAGLDTSARVADLHTELVQYGVRQRKLSCVLYQR